MQVRWYGQSAFALTAGPQRVFIDPFGSMDAAPARGMTWNYPVETFLDRFAGEIVTLSAPDFDTGGMNPDGDRIIVVPAPPLP